MKNNSWTNLYVVLFVRFWAIFGPYIVGPALMAWKGNYTSATNVIFIGSYSKASCSPFYERFSIALIAQTPIINFLKIWTSKFRNPMDSPNFPFFQVLTLKFRNLSTTIINRFFQILTQEPVYYFHFFVSNFNFQIQELVNHFNFYFLSKLNS